LSKVVEEGLEGLETGPVVKEDGLGEGVVKDGEEEFGGVGRVRDGLKDDREVVNDEDVGDRSHDTEGKA
jgi:hypothetical protein